MRWLRHVAPLAAALAISGCATSVEVGVARPAEPAVAVDPVAQPAPGFAVDPVAPGIQPFPECQVEEYAFAGQSSLAALGLADDLVGGGPDASRVGMIWVTANPVVQPQPAPIGDGKVPEQVAQRWVCVQWPDGSGMGGTVPDDWVPPADALTATVTQTQEIPIGTLAVVIGALVLIGFSIVAFRREGGRSTGEPSSV